MGSGTVLRENTHKRGDFPIYSDFLLVLGPWAAYLGTIYLGGTWEWVFSADRGNGAEPGAL
jgi:hypothetical protein